MLERFEEKERSRKLSLRVRKEQQELTKLMQEKQFFRPKVNNPNKSVELEPTSSPEGRNGKLRDTGKTTGTSKGVEKKSEEKDEKDEKKMVPVTSTLCPKMVVDADDDNDDIDM